MIQRAWKWGKSWNRWILYDEKAQLTIVCVDGQNAVPWPKIKGLQHLPKKNGKKERKKEKERKKKKGIRKKMKKKQKKKPKREKKAHQPSFPMTKNPFHSTKTSIHAQVIFLSYHHHFITILSQSIDFLFLLSSFNWIFSFLLFSPLFFNFLPLLLLLGISRCWSRWWRLAPARGRLPVRAQTLQAAASQRPGAREARDRRSAVAATGNPPQKKKRRVQRWTIFALTNNKEKKKEKTLRNLCLLLPVLWRFDAGSQGAAKSTVIQKSPSILLDVQSGPKWKWRRKWRTPSLFRTSMKKNRRLKSSPHAAPRSGSVSAGGSQSEPGGGRYSS